MDINYTDYHGFKLSAIGLGCSRLGSLLGSTTKESESLLEYAVDNGITYFDTASTYGQGDSERVLGRIIGKNDQILLVTKIGKRIPFKAKILQPFKSKLRIFARHFGSASTVIKKSRSGTLPTCFQTPFLTREIEACRHRLGVDCVPMIMLHSPTEETLRHGEAIEVIEKARMLGMVRLVGVSVDNLSAAEAALVDERISAIQIPYHYQNSAMIEWAERAEKAGKLVVAREIFGQIDLVKNENKKQIILNSIERMLSLNRKGVTLVGTTKQEHLKEAIEIAGSHKY
jgi:aryl-alcohol dehydrogenase-like predicted oxidoreductase